MNKFSLLSRVRRGFTLVEMLIVIAVIALLAGIAFPVFSRARESGRRSACSSNLKQLGLAFQQYTQDSGGRYPYAAAFFTDPTGANCFGASCSGWAPGKASWVVGAGLTETSNDTDINASNLSNAATGAYNVGKKANPEKGALYPYAKSTPIYFCPSNEFGQTKQLSYSMNCALTALSTVRIKTPTEIVLLVDEESANDGYFYAVDNALASATGNSTDALTKRHNGGGNLLFADGHVKFYNKEGFVLDDSAAGKANKWKTSGSVRFHDRAFGVYGSSSPVFDPINKPEIDTDFCDAQAGPGDAEGDANLP